MPLEASYGQMMRLFRDVAAGLAYVHGQRKMHRDLKPENVFLVRDGSGEYRAKLGDFGFAREAPGEAQARLSKKGTPIFIAPEQSQGKPYGQSSDIWALGVTLFNMLKRELPFTSQAQADSKPYKTIPGFVDPQVAEMIGNLLDKDPSKRMSAADILQRLAGNPFHSI